MLERFGIIIATGSTKKINSKVCIDLDKSVSISMYAKAVKHYADCHPNR